jgi:UDP-N-acetylglucosamine acyltransferase
VSIHPSSVVSKEAEIGRDVVIGPFCVITGRVKIGDRTRLDSHVSIGNPFGSVTIGTDNVFCAGAAVGGPPQDLSYKGEPTQLVIGDRNTIREFATLNCGTPKGGGITKVGSDCLIMAYAHVAHDCSIGNHVVIANSTQLAGHVIFEDHVKVGGMCGFNQFSRVGKYAFIAGDATVNKDIPPFTISQGNYAVVRACNSIGLDRAGFAKDDIEAVSRAIRIITKGGGTIEESLARIKEECAQTPSVQEFIEFVLKSKRGIAI